jgi:hypothetical protein
MSIVNLRGKLKKFKKSCKWRYGNNNNSITSYINEQVYIGRECKKGGWNLEESEFANPFPIGQMHGTRDQVVEKYKKYLYSNKDLLESVETLRGKILCCWCNYPKEKCHGKVLLEVLEQKALPLKKRKLE